LPYACQPRDDAADSPGCPPGVTRVTRHRRRRCRPARRRWAALAQCWAPPRRARVRLSLRRTSRFVSLLPAQAAAVAAAAVAGARRTRPPGLDAACPEEARPARSFSPPAAVQCFLGGPPQAAALRCSATPRPYERHHSCTYTPRPIEFQFEGLSGGATTRPLRPRAPHARPTPPSLPRRPHWGGRRPAASTASNSRDHFRLPHAYPRRPPPPLHLLGLRPTLPLLRRRRPAGAPLPGAPRACAPLPARPPAPQLGGMRAGATTTPSTFDLF
jgi:hypothetical protein